MACGIIIHPGRKTFGRMGLVPWTPEGLDGDTFEQWVVRCVESIVLVRIHEENSILVLTVLIFLSFFFGELVSLIIIMALDLAINIDSPAMWVSTREPKFWPIP